VDVKRYSNYLVCDGVELHQLVRKVRSRTHLKAHEGRGGFLSNQNWTWLDDLRDLRDLRGEGFSPSVKTH
jgi:hypothetical protein